MRLMIYSLVALMLVGVLGGRMLQNRAEREVEEQIEHVHKEVKRFQSQIMLQAALEQVELTDRGFPATIKPQWFLGNLPSNPLVGSGHAWLEIASESQRNLEHPLALTASSRDVAQFWYNPYTGKVRARVPAWISDAKPLEMYNRINECNLPDLFSSAQAIGP